MSKFLLQHQQRVLVTMCALAATLLLLMSSITSTASVEGKMRAEDVIAKHLESIGTEAARAGARNRVIVGTSRAVIKTRNNTGATAGRAVMASINKKVLFAMAFNSPDYIGEKFGYDGKKLTVGYLKPGARSTLGSFILIHDNVFKEGLMGGTLSSAWPLLNLAERKAKLEYAGLEKIDKKPVHKLRYSPSKGSDLEITLFFDAQTFQHVRTQYDRVVGARINTGGIDAQASQRQTRYKMVEDFSDFKEEGHLTLPHTYKLLLEIETTNGTAINKWDMDLNQFAFNQDIDEKGFDVEGK